MGATEAALSEPEVHAAEEQLCVSVVVQLLAVEVVSGSRDVRERNVLRADFPALDVVDAIAEERLVRRSKGDVLTHVTVSRVSTPGTLVGLLRTLVVELDVVSRSIALSLFVLGISAIEVPVLVELIASADRPDVGLIRILLEALRLREDVAVEMTVSSAAIELASRAVQSDALIVGCIIKS